MHQLSTNSKSYSFGILFEKIEMNERLVVWNRVKIQVYSLRRTIYRWFLNRLIFIITCQDKVCLNANLNCIHNIILIDQIIIFIKLLSNHILRTRKHFKDIPCFNEKSASSLFSLTRIWRFGDFWTIHTTNFLAMITCRLHLFFLL